MNLRFSASVKRDEELSAQGHRFLGAGKCDGKEMHVFLDKDSELVEKPIHYLVIIEKRDLELKYADRYRAYDNIDDAMEWAVENGYQSIWGTNKSVGVMNCYACGDVLQVSIMAVEVQRKKELSHAEG